MAIRTVPEPPLRLGAADQERLHAHLIAAVARARRRGEGVLASVTVGLAPTTDPSAVVCASRRPGEEWFVFEQPDHGGAALAALGAVVTLQASGPGRFSALAARWRALAADAVGDDPVAPGATGPVAVGGFSFAHDGGRSPAWEGFAPASLVVPELSIARGERDGRREVHLSLTALAAPDDVPDELLAQLLRRLDECARRRCRCSTHPGRRFAVSSVMPPEHYEQAVARAVSAIRDGDFEKIVLAREVLVRAPEPHDPAAVLGVLREAFPACFRFCVGRGDATLVAASPELLMRREGMRASTLALAGSTRRSADPAVDDHLGEQLLHSHKDRAEQAIVARRIERTLRPHAVWVTAAPEPALVRVANIQHLATPDPRAARAADRRHRARRADAPDAGRGRRAARGGGPADPGARGPGPWLVRRTGGLERPSRRRRVLRRAALRAVARPRRALLRGRGRGQRIRPGRRARRDRDQALGAAAGAGRLTV